MKGIFTGLTTPPPRPNIYMTRMLTRDLFAVANFLGKVIATKIFS